MKILIILPVLLLTSCSTVIPKDSNKSFRNKWNNDIVWNKKIYKSGAIVQTYDDVKSMYTDSQETQDKISLSNEYSKKSSIFLWGGFAAAITYLVSSDDPSMGTYWGLFGVGFFPGLYYERKRNNLIDGAIENYNKVKGYSLSPVIDKNNQVGGKLLATFSF